MKHSIEDILGRRSAATTRTIAGTRCVRMINGHEGEVGAGAVTMRVLIEPDDWVRFHAPAPSPASSAEALQIGATLPGNLRFARRAQELELCGDTRVDGAAHLRRTFREAAVAIARLHPAPEGKRRPRASKAEPPTAAALKTAIGRLGWPEERVVERGESDGWELRPRVAGRACPVQVRVEDGQIRVHAVVMAGITAEAREAVAHAALFVNARLRLARLELDKERLVAASGLHGGLVSAAWLAAAARAVATARHEANALPVLVQHAGVRRRYVQLFSVRDSQASASSPEKELAAW